MEVGFGRRVTHGPGRDEAIHFFEEKGVWVCEK
jgi:hypothetical protein